MSERKLRNVVTEWKDGRHFMTTSRVHIFVWMLSGFDMANLKDLLVNEDFVEMILKVQDTTLNKATKKVFDHRMFDQDYFVQEDGQPPQPVASAIANAISGLKKSNDKGDVYYKIRIPLPKGRKWDFAPIEVSGHHPVVPLEIKKEKEGKKKHSKIILMIDLTDNINPDIPVLTGGDNGICDY